MIEQFPDWYDDPSTPENEKATPPHTFSPGDHFQIQTKFLDHSDGPAYRVDVVGGSTFDSDIFYNGLVERNDLGRLNDLLLLRTIEDMLLIRDNDSLFDPTSDINWRCPNGAGGEMGDCSWSWEGPPRREIGLGDFGPLNVEFRGATVQPPKNFGRARAPFVDLDPDNSSGVRGVDFVTQPYDGGSVQIAPDARFANFLNLEFRQLSVILTNRPDGDAEGLTVTADTEEFKVQCTPYDPDTGELLCSGLDTVEDYTLVLRSITYSNGRQPPTSTPRVITVKAIGGSDFVYSGVDQTAGNQAKTTVVFAPAADAVSFASGEAGEPNPLFSIAGESESSNTWQNPANRFDVNATDGVTPLDALMIINYLNDHPDISSLPSVQTVPARYYDVNGDGLCSALDALWVINHMESVGKQLAEGEADVRESARAGDKISPSRVPSVGVPIQADSPVGASSEKAKSVPVDQDPDSLRLDIVETPHLTLARHLTPGTA